jgi:hypothetical protein
MMGIVDLMMKVHVTPAVVNMAGRWNIWLEATIIPNCVIIIIIME